MNFLYPGFLFSLLAVAIPILIHLFNFRSFKKVYFSNVQFLKAAKEDQAARSKVKDLLILLCRILVIIFLVLAFARPYISYGPDINPEAGNLINIYIDNSYSMESVNKEGSLLDEARRKAKEIAKQFSPNDRFQLITNDFEGRHQRLVGYEAFLNLVDEIKISPASRTLQQVLNRQRSITGGNRYIHNYVLSDFQKGFAGNTSLVTDSNANFSFIRILANTIPNIAVDSIWSLSPAHKPGDQEKFVVKLHNYGEEAGKAIPIKMEINGQQRAVARVNIPAGKSINDTLSFGGLTAGWQKASLLIKDYPVVFDDEMKFSFKVGTGLKILQISGDPSERYIRSLFSGDQYFKLSSMPESNISYASFSGYDLIVVSGLKSASSGLAQQLNSYVKNGGSVLVFPDLNSSITEFSSFLKGLSLPQVASISSDTVIVSHIDLKNKLFNDVFENIPVKVDLPKVNRHFVYANNNTSSRQDVMEIPGKQSFFSRYQLGAGQVYLSAVSLNKNDSNFPEHPIFVPLLYNIAFNSVQQSPLYYTISKDNQLSSAQFSINPGQALKLLSKDLEIIPDVRQVPGKTLLYIADQVKLPGYYQLKLADSLLNTYAFNQNRAESDMHYTDDQEIKRRFGNKNLKLSNSITGLSSVTVENNHTDLWKLCLVLCAVFLAIEALLIRFFNKLKI